MPALAPARRTPRGMLGRAAVTCALAIALLFPLGCSAPADPAATDATPPVQPEATPSTPPLGTIIFDMGHGEIFGAEDTSELGHSQAIAQMMRAGYRVGVNSDAITADDLRGASGLVIAGPMRPLTDDEYAIVTSFIQAGGTVLLTIHVPYPVLKVPAHWGLPVDTRILMSRSPAADPAQPSVFVASDIAASPLTEGVAEVLVVSGWPVGMASAEAELLVSSGSETWLTEAGDQQPVPPEGTQFASYGVIGVTELGAGRIVVSGDDAIFANLALGQADNAQLLANILRLMTAATEI